MNEQENERDPEIAALCQIVEILSGVDAEAARRMIRWLESRYSEANTGDSK